MTFSLIKKNLEMCLTIVPEIMVVLRPTRVVTGTENQPHPGSAMEAQMQMGGEKLQFVKS